MRSWQKFCLFLAVPVVLIGACSEGKFRRDNERKGEEVPQERPFDQSQQNDGQPRNEQGNPVDENGNELPRPGKGVDTSTGQVPVNPGYDPRRDPNSPYNPSSPNYNPTLPPYNPNQPYGPGTNPGGPGVNIYPPTGINEPAPYFPGNPGYWNPYGPNGPYNPVLTERVFNVSCHNGVNVFEEFSAHENQRIKAIIRGQLCPQSMTNSLVLFVVDFSGSMGPHFDDDINGFNPGHDPVRPDGSCGRFDAANQIYQTMINLGEDADFAMLPFASNAMPAQGIRPTPMSRVGRHMRPDKFCQYVPQSDEHYGPGAMMVPTAGPSTNYADAFANAREMLARSGRENLVMYFISDGEPNEPGTRQDALNAATLEGMALRTDPRIRSLIINGLYLGNPASATYQNAHGILSQVTGSPNRVVPVEQASMLATAATQFPQPTINLNTNEYRTMASLVVRPFRRQPFGVQSLYEIGPNLWEYQTQPFLLLGLPGRVIENKVRITINGRNGFLHKTNVIIRYRML